MSVFIQFKYTLYIYNIFSGAYLKEIILQTLNKFKVKRNQLYTITTDNGANIVKAVQLIENEIEILLESEKDCEPENQKDSGEILGPDISLDGHNSDSSSDSETKRLILWNKMHVFKIYFWFTQFRV